MGKGKKEEVVARFKRTGLNDEFISDLNIEADTHTEMGTEHSDFPRQQDPEADPAILSASIELHEALNEWICIMNDRVSHLERCLAALETS